MPESSAAPETRPLIERRIGDLTITRIHELALTAFAPGQLIPDLASRAADAGLFPNELASPEGNVMLRCHSWLLRDGKRTMLIDTGVGAGKGRPFAPYFDNREEPFLERLAGAGVAPDEVDVVLLTHLHVDHVGWNTISRNEAFVPTFPNARYLFSEAEYRFFCAEENHVERHRTSFMARADSVDPVVTAGQAEMIATDGREVLSGVRFLATPGHSPFHASILIETDAGAALFAGDTLHHHAQVLQPEANCIFDAEPDRARASRRLLLERAARPDTTTFGAHLAGTSVVRIARTADGFRWEMA